MIEFPTRCQGRRRPPQGRVQGPASARAAARERFREFPWELNSHIPASQLRKRFSAQKPAMQLLHQELDAERLSARGLHKTLRVAWSIADLIGATIPTLECVEEAYRLRAGTSEIL